MEFSAGGHSPCCFVFPEYLSTFAGHGAEMFLLQTRQPALILQAISQIVHGRSTGACCLDRSFLSLTLGWIVLASLGRAATLKDDLRIFSGQGAVEGCWGKTGYSYRSEFPARGALLAAVVSSIGAALVSGAARRRPTLLLERRC